MSGGKWNGGIEPMRALVDLEPESAHRFVALHIAKNTHVQIRPKAMPRPVQVVQALLPKRPPCKDVKLLSARALRKDGTIDRDLKRTVNEGTTIQTLRRSLHGLVAHG